MIRSFFRLFALPLGLGTLLSSGLSQPLQHPYTDNDTSWYNRKKGITQYLIEIEEGAPRNALRHARQQGLDAEADFIQALAYARLGMPDSAMHFVEQSLQKRLPLTRYQLPGAPYLNALRQIPAFQELVQDGNIIVHGPMLGQVGPTSASVWVRTQGEHSFWVEWSLSRDFSRSTRSSGGTQANRQFTETVRIFGLKAQTRYFYRMGQGDRVLSETFSFTTSPKTGKGGQFSVIFGGGAAYIPWHHGMWSVIASHQADALFMLGDNVYIDYPTRPYVQQYCYHRRQSEAHWRRLMAQTPVYAIWDDHDFGDNDDYGGPEPDSPAWKMDVLELFKQQWVDPGYGGDEGLAGVFFSHQMADVEFFFLDGRYYRQPSFVGAEHSEPVSMLGEAQKAWLKRSLLASDARFKVIISPVPWAFDAKPALEGKVDTWGGYQEERTELFDFLTDNNVQGVFLLSADRHRSDVWEIERENDYPLYEFESSRLTNTHFHGIMPGSVFGYNQTNSFGKLVFDTAGEEPSIVYEIYTINNELIYSFELPPLE